MTSRSETFALALVLAALFLVIAALRWLTGGGRRAAGEAQDQAHGALKSLRAWRKQAVPEPPPPEPEPSGELERDPQWPNHQLDALEALRAWRKTPPPKDGA